MASTCVVISVNLGPVALVAFFAHLTALGLGYLVFLLRLAHFAVQQ